MVMERNSNVSPAYTPPRHVLSTKSPTRHRGLALATSSPELRLIRNDLMPKLALIECAPADLVVPTRNVRKIKAVHLREIANAISSLGFCDPVLIDERNTVLDGVVRV